MEGRTNRRVAQGCGEAYSIPLDLNSCPGPNGSLWVDTHGFGLEVGVEMPRARLVSMEEEP